jgi:outer membrane receptor protein involved in Fe transport
VFGVALSGSPVLAQQAQFEEIVVTGQRIERTLFETASSVFVLTAEGIERVAGASDSDDLLALTPNVTLGPGDSAPAIRGQDSTGALSGVDAFLGGTRPRSTISIDGRALNFNEYLYGTSSIWDLARVEIFRGPQTTTQGRNSIAGAVFFVTRDPAYDFEGAVRAEVAEFSTQQASLALSGPIQDDRLAARVSVDWREGDRTVRDTGLVNTVSGVDTNADDLLTARLKLLFDPTDDLRLKLTYSHSEATGPQAEAADAPFGARESSSIFAGVFDTESDAVILNADARLSDAWTSVNTLTLTKLDVERITTPTFGTGHFDIEEVSVESIMRYQPTDGALSGLFGVYYLDAEQDEVTDFSGFLGTGNFNDQQSSLGIFGEATFEASTGLFLTAGARFQRDEQTRGGSLAFLAVDYDESFDAFLPKFEVAYDLNDAVRIGVTAQRGYNPGGTTISFVDGSQDTFDAEYVWNYEAFLRSTLFDGRLALSGNVFYAQYDDAQRSTNVEGPPGFFTTVYSNADKARATGLEVEAVYAVSETLTLRGALGLLDTEIEEFSISSDPIEGNEFQRAPPVSGTIAITWRPIDKLTLDWQTRYTDEYFSNDLNSPELKTESTAISDFQASYQLGSARIFAYARNVFDEDYVTYLYSTTLATLAESQRLGAGVEVRF